MKVDNLAMTEGEKEVRRMELDAFQHETNLTFLKSHRGHRNGKVHMYLGLSGAGKSTMLRTLIGDYQENNPATNIGVWLSEESIDDLKNEWSKVDTSHIQSQFIKVVSEMDMNKSNLELLKRNIVDFIKKNQISIFFMDNITTSGLYMGRNETTQSQVLDYLKEICNELDIPFIFFCHTNKNVTPNTDRLLNENDVRGSGSLVNLAQYFYIMQRFELGNLFFPTIKITKYRGYSVDERLYYLNYDKQTSTFTKDWFLPWDEFNEAYKRRNVLGKNS